MDEKPSLQLADALQHEKDIPLISALAQLAKTPQSPTHHPEGNVWNHTLLVVDEAAKRRAYSQSAQALMWAALLHDIGKAETTKMRKGRITAYDHDKAGANLAHRLLLQLSGKAELAGEVMWLVRYHMQPFYVVKGLPFQDIPGIKRHTSVAEVALLSYCDRLGRGNADQNAEKETILTFVETCHEQTDALWLKNQI